MRTWEWAAILVLVVAGVYMLVFHSPPLPWNHEEIGLGTFHLAHDAIGIVLLASAGFVWWRSRRAAPATTPA